MQNDMLPLLFSLMIFSEPISFAEALASRAVKAMLPTSLGSRELAQIEPALRERAMFSARTTNAGYLQQVNDLVSKLADGKTDQATVRLKLKQALQALDYQPDPEKRGGIQDLSSDARLNLVIETNTRMAQGYGFWQQGQDEDLLFAFPAQELYRAEARAIPRDWQSRWAEAGGEFFEGRMIALKDDPIWVEISAFGLPYPPFDFRSGMDVRDVNREEAEQFGLITPEERVEPQDRGFNDGLQAAASEDFAQETLDALGDAYELVKGVLQLKSPLGNSRFYERDSLGRFSSTGLSVRDNIARGTRAMRRALRHGRDVQKAMVHEKLGVISFPWGTPGEKSREFKGGFGVSHILAKHGRKEALALPEVIAKGKVFPHTEDPINKRLVLHKNFEAVLVKEKTRQAWLLTGFKNRRQVGR